MNETAQLQNIEATIAAVVGGLRPGLRRLAAHAPSAARQAAADARQIVAFIAMAAVDCHVAMNPPERADAARSARSTGLAHMASFLAGNGLRRPQEQVRAMLEMQVAGADIVGWGHDPTRLFAAAEDMERLLFSRTLSPTLPRHAGVGRRNRLEAVSI